MNSSIKDYLVASYPNRGVTFTKGEGVYLIDEKGRKYLDLGSNYGVNIFGYHHPRVTKALENQLKKLITLHGSFGNQVRNEAARNLVDRCNHGLSRVFFSNSGAEANEAALKFARLATSKSHFIAMEHGYHGKTLGALSATGGDKYRNPFMPLLWNFTHVPFGDLKAVRQSITEDTAAIITEPIQGEGGILFAPDGFFKDLRKLCQEKKVLLIVDEIQTGLGRTGTFLASEQVSLKPDILCLGKGLAAGIPIGATLVTEEIAQKILPAMHTSTFGSNPLACAGILAVLKELENKKILAQVKKIGQYFLSELKKIKNPQIVEVRGLGLMIGMELTEKNTSVLKALQDKKIIALPAGSNIVRFLPPYLINKKQVDQTIKALKTIFN